MRKFTLFALCLIVPAIVHAHVGYVTTPEDMAQSGGADWSFLAAPFMTSELFLILATIVILIALILTIPRIGAMQRLAAHLHERTEGYTHLTPWMLRLSLGIMLIGAGSSEVLLAQGHSTSSLLATGEILFGFLILAGVLTGPAVLGALLIYGLAIASDSYFLGNLDVLGIIFALLVSGSAFPGIDDLFGINTFPRLGLFRSYVPLILRLGLGGAMTYLAIYEKLLNPHLSALVIEQYGLAQVIPVSVELWVLAAGLIELAVGLAILFGITTRLTSAIAFLVLSLSFFYFGEDVYSHITLFGTLSALFVTGGGTWSFDAWWKKKFGSSSS